MATLPERIKELRKNAKLSQQEFGALFGMAKSTVSQYESGRNTPNDEIKMAIAKYFDVSLDYLLGATDIPRDSGKTADEVSDAIYSVLLEIGVIAPGEQLSKEKIEYVKKLLNKAIELSQL